MLNWFKKFTKRTHATAKKNKRGRPDRILDEIKSKLADISARATNNTVDIEELQKQVSTISDTVARLSATLETPLQTKVIAPATLPPALVAEEFTHLQEATLLILFRLLSREDSQWIPIKLLVNNIYPGQDYNRVRTTIFEHMRLFEDLGLIRRAKHGTRTFITLTEKGRATAKRKLAGKAKKALELPEIEA